MLTIRTAEQDDDAKAILEFLRQMHAEVGRAPLKDDKALMTMPKSRVWVRQMRNSTAAGAAGVASSLRRVTPSAGARASSSA